MLLSYTESRPIFGFVVRVMLLSYTESRPIFGFVVRVMLLKCAHLRAVIPVVGAVDYGEFDYG